MQQKYSVRGMTCSACSAGIEKAVKSLDGVTDCQVSLMGKSMTVEFDAQKVTETDVILTVEKLGYSASIFNADDDIDTDYSAILKKRFFISLFLLLPLIYLSMGKMLKLPVFDFNINLPLQALLALVIIIINFKFYTSGTRAVINLSPNMDTLVGLGSASAYIYSLVATVFAFINQTPVLVFFESSAMILVLVTLGKWLEELSKGKTSRAIDKITRLIPKTVTVIKDGKQTTVLTSQVQLGDLVVIKAGEYIAVDGIVIDGVATVDKSAITGESLPEEVCEGENVTSGSILKTGCITVTAEKVGEQTLFSQIITAVKNAGTSKAPIQKLADRVSAWFVPTVTFIALVVFIVRIILTKDVYSSFNFAISVLVISCPCALGLATPVAVMVATGKAASMGILFKDAQSLQKAKDINCVLLDKTATLTVGEPKVVDFRNYSDLKNQEIFNISTSLEQMSNHPLSKAVIEFCNAKGSCTVMDFNYQLGKGLTGKIDGVEYRLGNYCVSKELLEEFSGKSVVALSSNDTLIAVFAVSDYLKEDSKQAVERLNAQGIKTVMITGDNYGSAKSIAKQVGITEFCADVLSQDKAQQVNNYREKGFTVAMVGDGINDSPALKEADVGIAMGAGTDIAIESANVVLVSGNLEGVHNAIELSKKTVKIIKGNLFWAFIYNALMIPVAAGVLSSIGIVLTPTISAGCMCISSLFVVTNALRINAFKKQTEKNIKGETFMEIVVKGMMCKHCQAKVEEGVKLIPGVQTVSINLKKGIVKISGDVSFETVKAEIENLGYQVVGQK